MSFVKPCLKFFCMKKKVSPFVNRELAWLSFNERVLQEAADPTVPVIERMIFLGIFSSNTDEFFRVRVASIKRLILAKNKKFEYPIDPVQTLKDIKKTVGKLMQRFEEVFEWNIEELKKQNIHCVNETQVNLSQGKFIKEYFHQNVRRHIFPVFLDKIKSSENWDDTSNFLAVQLSKRGNTSSVVNMVIEIPVGKLSRFLILPSKSTKKYLILLDDVIRFCLDEIFGSLGYDEFRAYTFKFIRDAELNIDYEKEDPDYFVNYLTEKLKDRSKGKAVRLVHDKKMPRAILEKLQQIFEVPRSEVFDSGGRYQNKKDFVNFPKDFDNQGVLYPPFKPMDSSEFPIKVSKFKILKAQDVMLHYPYQSFQHVIDLVREASIDPKVMSIKMTIYRVAKDSSILNALINAVRNGKTVKVFMEVMARFDEENNIDWAKRLKQEGVEIIPVIPGFKVHAKLILISRKEHGEKVYYGAIGTGNPNEQTAKLYVDDHLLTSNPKITKEINAVFKLITSSDKKSSSKELLVAPHELRHGFEKLIDIEIANAKAGKPAWIKAKMNSLADVSMVNKLYEASKANVKVSLVVRGICILKTGIPDLSSNIEVVSVVSRFLEHSRVFIFGNAGKPKFYIGSADWMTRNLDYRVEVATPIYDENIQEDLLTMIDIQLSDNTHARYVTADETTNNTYKRPKNGSKRINSQEKIYEYLKKKYSN